MHLQRIRMQTFFIAPTDFGVGLTSISLGLVPTRSASYAARVNLHLAKSLDAEVILVSAPENEVLTELSGRVELQAQLFGGPKDPKVLGVILNKVRTDESMDAFAARLKEHSP